MFCYQVINTSMALGDSCQTDVVDILRNLFSSSLFRSNTRSVFRGMEIIKM